MVADDVNLLNFLRRRLPGRPSFRSTRLRGSGVTNRFDAGAVFTDAVVEILQTLLDIRDGRAVKRLAHPNTRGLEVLLEHVIFHRLIAGEGDAGDRRTLFHLHQQGITIAQDADVLKVASGKQRARIVLLISSSVTVSPGRTGILRGPHQQRHAASLRNECPSPRTLQHRIQSRC